jgi:hypothetical protein
VGRLRDSFWVHDQPCAASDIGTDDGRKRMTRIVREIPVDERKLREFCFDAIPLATSRAAWCRSLGFIVR